MIELIKWAKGNPGALTFLMSLIDPENGAIGMYILPKIEELTTIRGGDLYVLWSDLCGKNLEKVKQLVEKCPQDILTDACSRQDYSGRQLVAEYLN